MMRRELPAFESRPLTPGNEAGNIVGHRYVYCEIRPNDHMGSFERRVSDPDLFRVRP